MGAHATAKTTQALAPEATEAAAASRIARTPDASSFMCFKQRPHLAVRLPA
jgi:hypothetical protein